MKWLIALAAATLSWGAAPAPSRWIPARWHSHDIATLMLLRDTPVNCLLLEYGDWDVQFIRTASQQDIATFGIIRPGSEPSALVRRAMALPLAGIVLEGDFDAPVDTGSLPKIELPSRTRIKLDSAAPVVGTSQALWPGLEIEHSGKTIAGPTSAPWIHTNGGFLRFLRARTGRTVWLAVQPPPRTIFPVERYLQAIGDAAISGARWILAFDNDFESRLYRREPNAMKDWQRIADHLRFYERWHHAADFGKFGVVMDRSSGGLFSSFLLDMLAAQRTSAKVIPPGSVTPRSLKDISILLNLETTNLTSTERKALEAFAARNGVILTPPKQTRFPALDPDTVTPARRDLDQLQSLWEMIYNATLRKNFGVRAFNTVGVLTGIATPDSGKSVLVHLLNFTDYEGEAITVHALGIWRRATLHLPEGPSKVLNVYSVREGTAVDIERFKTSAVIQFE